MSAYWPGPHRVLKWLERLDSSRVDAGPIRAVVMLAWALTHYGQVRRWYYFDAMERLIGVDGEDA